MSAARELKFANEDDALAEVARLERGYRAHGNWTLAQIAWHVGKPIASHLKPAADDAVATPEQTKLKQTFVDVIIQTGKPPAHAKVAPPSFVPPADAADADIQRYKKNLREMKAFGHPRVMMGPIGPVTIEEFRICNLTHAAHHLAFLEPVPASRREGLSFGSEDEVIAEVKKLQQSGYARTGNWSLAQICHHLDKGVQARLATGPFGPNTSEQDARKSIAEEVLKTGKLPAGIVAPEPFQPPADCGDEAIEALTNSLMKLKAFKGQIAPHRLFGHLSDADARRLNLIHCAHHLSYLVPIAPAGARS